MTQWKKINITITAWGNIFEKIQATSGDAGTDIFSAEESIELFCADIAWYKSSSSSNIACILFLYLFKNVIRIQIISWILNTYISLSGLFSGFLHLSSFLSSTFCWFLSSDESAILTIDLIAGKNSNCNKQNVRTKSFDNRIFLLNDK